MIKKIAIILSILIVTFSATSCSKIEEEYVLTDEDMKYIDCVYSYLDVWDKVIYDSGEYVPIQKIAFYDFDGTNNICFYGTYSIMTKYFGYYINGDTMELIDPSIYDHDLSIIHRGWSGRVEAEGTVWNYNASKKEKYETLKHAFKNFRETDIYAED